MKVLVDTPIWSYALRTDSPKYQAEINEITTLIKCRKKGIQGSHIDFLICAVAKRLSVPVFTTDKDFSHLEKHSRRIPASINSHPTSGPRHLNM